MTSSQDALAQDRLERLEAIDAIDAPPVVKELVVTMPDLGVGDALRDAVVNRAAGSTPGHASTTWGGQGDAFRDTFFPGWGAGPYYGSLGADTGLDDAWWSSVAVALLCTGIARFTTTESAHVDGARAAADLASASGRLSGLLVSTYAAVFAATWPDLTTALQQTDATLGRAAAADAYEQLLIQSIPIHRLWAASGEWTDPGWELFHHAAKLLLLGRTAAQVDALMAELAAGGLPMPPAIAQGAWRSYTQYLGGHPAIDVDRLPDATRAAMTAATLLEGYGEVPPEPDGNSAEFVANGQPGSRYWNGG